MIHRGGRGRGFLSINLPMTLPLTPAAGSIFRPLSLTQKSGSEFSDEILRSALLDIQPTFKCPVEWIHVIPPPRLDWECWTWNISNCRMKRAEAREEARRAAAKYGKMASYVAAAMKILAEDSEDDTDHEDTPTPPTFTLQLFLDSLFLWRNEPRNEPGVPSYSD